MAHSSQTSSAGTSNNGTQHQLEPSLRHFADPSFDPIDFINDSFPPLTLSASQPHASRAPGSVSLGELSSRSQSLVSQTSTQNVRLSGILTQLTEEILRSGGRLAYEVEVLRGESISLADTLAETLHKDIIKFVPEVQNEGELEDELKGGAIGTEREKAGSVAKLPEEPEYIAQLRILGQVRARLEEVIQTFGDAMEWPLPPSELSITSSFISVSAPEPGTESHSREERGQEIAKKLRTEITELLNSKGGGDAGLAAATRRLEALRNLGTVWRGTAEDKARTRFLDSLAKIIEDRRRALENQRERASKKGRSSMDQIAEERSNTDSGPGGGLFRNLQRIRDEIYLEESRRRTMFELSRFGSPWRNLPHIPLRMPRMRISRVIIYTVGSVLFIFCLFSYSSRRDSSAPNIQVPGNQDWELPPPFDPSNSAFHVLVSATPKSPQLCRTITSAMILDYPPMTLLKPNPEPRTGSTSNKAAIENVQSILTFLKTNKRVGDRDLVLIVDSDDTLFQLPSDILIDRYGEITRQKNEHLRSKYGMKFVGNVEDEGTHHLVQKYTQRVLFASRKDCYSNLTDTAACASVPQSPLPPDIYGLKTDKKHDGTKNRPRWIESSIIMGQTFDLIPLYERVLQEMQKQPSRAGDQMMFTHIFGAQEYSRETERRKTSSPFKEWLWDFVGISEASNITNVRAHIQPGDRHEYGIGLDYEGQLFLNTRKTTSDIEWLRYRDFRKASSVQIEHGVPREVRLNLPLDIEQNPLNPFKKDKSLNILTSKTANMSSIDVIPPSWNFTWNDLPLATYIQTAAVPAIIHTNGESSVRQSYWDHMWFHPWSRALLRKHMRSGQVEPIQQISALGASDLLKYPDRKGGMWADNDEWMSFEDLCSGFEDAVFGDGLGAWGGEKSSTLRAVYNLWGRLMAGKGPKTKKLGESKSETEEIEKLVLGIEEEEEEEEGEDSK
ncbi:hypothetical protein UA08_01551 [Talaromyces atroroseus]|uniref:Uncharacterized protein n=1 Tax=Talaromyces atroroseus TaxID=1441469 RepID=A0A1Q5QC36_TALAT|nr:hypothetical protein UA08_01551 [Talaromyces atroroseus]OKL63494.1 hypothetical protein UA08_01551 [Talaromyces atroroseus]